MKTFILAIVLFSSCFAEQKELLLDRNFNLFSGFPETLAKWQVNDKTVLYTQKQIIHDMESKYAAIALYFQSKDDALRIPRVEALIEQNINDRLLLTLAMQHKVLPSSDNILPRLKAINKWADSILAKELTVSDAEIEIFYKNNAAKFTAPATADKAAHIVALDDRLRKESHTFLLRQKTTALLMKKLKAFKKTANLKEFYKK